MAIRSTNGALRSSPRSERAATGSSAITASRATRSSTARSRRPRFPRPETSGTGYRGRRDRAVELLVALDAVIADEPVAARSLRGEDRKAPFVDRIAIAHGRAADAHAGERLLDCVRQHGPAIPEHELRRALIREAERFPDVDMTG